MHNISKKDIQDLANHLASTSERDDTLSLLEKARELYEKAILLHHTTTVDVKPEIPEKSTIDIVQTVEETTITDAPESNTINVKKTTEEPIKTEITEAEENDLSVHERIKKIMETAPHFEISSDKKNKQIEEEIPFETPEKKIEKTTDLPKVNLEDEFKDAISADYAADLFEKAEKIEASKKSLNDTLSQKQLQIGLNDRIAFVKHLFDGSQPDFNRVLSQLNSFQTEVQAKTFISTVVKPDYNWKDKTEYEERLIALIERKFL